METNTCSKYSPNIIPLHNIWDRWPNNIKYDPKEPDLERIKVKNLKMANGRYASLDPDKDSAMTSSDVLYPYLYAHIIYL